VSESGQAITEICSSRCSCSNSSLFLNTWGSWCNGSTQLEKESGVTKWRRQRTALGTIASWFCYIPPR